MILEGTEVNVGCSIGGAVWPLSDRTPLEVMHLADEALYFIKRNGKNNIHFYVSK